MSARYHIGRDGNPRICKAKTPETCKCQAPDGMTQFHGSEKDVEAKIVEEYKNAVAGDVRKNSLSKSDNADNRADGKADSLVAALSNENVADAVDEDGNVISLLSDQMKLAEDRKGKVPALKPGDDSVTAQGKLAKYIINNVVGDRTKSEEDAITTLYGGNVVKIADDDSTFEYGAGTEAQAAERRAQADRQKRYLEHQTGGEVHRYWNGDRLVFVCSSRKTGKTTSPDIVFRGTRMKGAQIDYGNLQAASAVFKRMGMEDADDETRSKVASGLMESGRRYSNVLYLNRTDLLDPNIVMRCNSNEITKNLRDYGVEMPDAPRVTDPSDDAQREAVAKYLELASGKYVEALNAAGFTYDDIRVQDMFHKSQIMSAMASKARNRGVKEKYQEAISGLLRDESNSELNKSFLKRSMVEHAATVYEDKKHRDPKHDEAGRKSQFQQDFGRIEVDDSVDLGKFSDLGSEYADYRKKLPAAAIAPDLRFRYTGRHNATGLYTTDGKDLHNVAVDPRYPKSMTHEMFHHFDFTSEKGRQVSMDPEFSKIVKHYQATIDKTAMGGTNPDRYIAPTEVFARAGELWMSEKVGSSSFLDTREEYASRFDFKPLLDMKDDVIAFMDKHFKPRG